MKSLTSLGALSPERACRISLFPNPALGIRARTPGGHPRPRWNKTNSVARRSSNKSVLKRESGCRRGDPTVREGWDHWESAEGQAQGEPRCHCPCGQSPFSCLWRALGCYSSQILLLCTRISLSPEQDNAVFNCAGEAQHASGWPEKPRPCISGLLTPITACAWLVTLTRCLNTVTSMH